MFALIIEYINQRFKNVPHNVFQMLVALDQFLNTLLTVFANSKSWADETLSSRAWRQYVKPNGYKWPKKVIDAIFFFRKDHCKTAFESERNRAHLPPRCRDGSD